MSICDCSGINVDVPHTMFLGCSISNVSASVGWNTTSSSMEITLNEDVCDGDKVYYNECLNKVDYSGPDFGFFGEKRWEDSEGNQYSSCLPLNVGDTLIRDAIDIIGVPAFLRLGTFEWCGIITDWTRQQGCPSTYTVHLSDPRLILQSVHLLTGGYSGRVDQVGATGCETPNLFNVFGYMEQFGIYCPEQINATDGLVFGSPFNGFGGSNWNEDGMPWNQVLLGFNLLANALPINANVFSPYGRVSFYKPIIPAALVGSACGLMQPAESVIPCADAFDYYFVDLTELPALPNSYRVNAASTSLMEVIDQIASDFAFDYYIDLVPVQDPGFTPCVIKFIKVRVVYRTNQPAADAICDFIGQAACVSQASIGKELRGEVSSKFIVGANKHTIFQAFADDNPDANFTNPANDDETLASLNPCTNQLVTVTDPDCPEIDDMILPYFGRYANGNLVKVCRKCDLTEEEGPSCPKEWVFYPETLDINSNMEELTVGSPTIMVRENELRAALGNKDTWMAYIEAAETDTWQALDAKDILAIQGLALTFDYANQEMIAPRDLQNPHQKKAFDQTDEPGDARISDDIQELFDWILKFGRDYYGKQFAVRVPFSCCYPDYENGKLRVASEPTNEGGWTEVANVIGLTNNGALSVGSTDYLNFFRTDDGRIAPFVRVTGVGGVDVSHFEREDYIWFSGDINTIYIKAILESQYAHYDETCCYAPRVVINLPQSVEERKKGKGTLISGLDETRKIFNNVKNATISEANLIEGGSKNPGNSDIWTPWQSRAIMIDAACIPLKHHTISYGPWTQPSNTGAQIKVEVDPSINPWSFGSYATMNTAAQFLVDNAQINMKDGEMGSITVVGYPTLPLGAEIGAVAGGFYGSGSYLVENRAYTLSNISGFTYRNYGPGDISANPDGDPISIDYITLGIGPWQGLFGPNTTGISINGGCPPTTTYNMKTFSPRRLGMDKWMVTQLQKVNTLQQYQTKYIRSMLQDDKKRKEHAARGKADHRHGPKGRIEEDKSPVIGFIGNYKEESDETRRAIVNAEKTANFSQEMQVGYDEKAMMSIDGLLRPVSLGGDGGLPGFVSYTALALPGSIIHQADLNPLSNPIGWDWDDVAKYRSDTPEIGHDIDLVARGSDGNENNPTPSGGLLMRPAADHQGGGIKHGAVKPAKADYRDDYRFMALKGPLVMQGWGYDTDGFPVPNKNDTVDNARLGFYQDDPDLLHPDKFLDNHLMRPDTWVVAPIDLRLDRKRGVWVSAGGDGQLPTFSTTYDCVIDNPTQNMRIRPCDDPDKYFVRSNNFCFGAGITWEVPCDEEELSYSVDPESGQFTPCTPVAPKGSTIPFIKIGAATRISATTVEDDPNLEQGGENNCLIDEYRSWEGTGDNPAFYRTGDYNRFLFDPSIIFKTYDNDPCKIRMGTSGVSETIEYLRDVEFTCNVPTGDTIGGTVEIFVQKFYRKEQFFCGLLGEVDGAGKDTESGIEELCKFALPDCCDDYLYYYLDNLDGGNGTPLARQIDSGVTYAINSHSGETLSFTMTAGINDNVEMTSMSAIGNYFKPSPLITPSLPHTVPSGTSQVFSIEVTDIPSDTDLRLGIVKLVIDGGDERQFGVQGIIDDNLSPNHESFAVASGEVYAPTVMPGATSTGAPVIEGSGSAYEPGVLMGHTEAPVIESSGNVYTPNLFMSTRVNSSGVLVQASGNVYEPALYGPIINAPVIEATSSVVEPDVLTSVSMSAPVLGGSGNLV